MSLARPWSVETMMVRGLELLTFLLSLPRPHLALNDRMLDINEADPIIEVSELPETGGLTGLTLNLDDKSQAQIDLEKVPDVETEV